VFNVLIKGFIILSMLVGAAIMVAFVYKYEEITLDTNVLVNYKPETSSIIYDRYGKKLAYVFKDKHRLYARYDEIPGFLIEGLVAMEDTRFFEHNGVNPDAILRAIVKDIKAGAFVEGGSTLTQQLIKYTMLTSEKKIARKITEAILALKLEKELNKEEIIERYLNEVSYGNNYYGVKTASKGYFHKELHELTHKEAAILVGLPNAPSKFNPLRHYKRALNRANNVLYRMKSIGWITQDDYLKAVKESPKVYRTSLTQNIAPGIVDEVLRRFKGKLGDIRTGGYEIYTTIDMKQQEIAKDAVKYSYNKALEKYKEDANTSTLSAALVAVESKTGDILAMVGTTDYEKSSFNRVTQSSRQPGSAFKPFIFQTALDMGYNPGSPLTDLARTFQYTHKGKPKIWAPKNYGSNFKGFISFRESLVKSSNLATINLVADIGVNTIRKRLEFLDVPHIPRNMSISLGNLGLSPLKMAQIFSVFANGGHMIEPRLVSKIISKEGAIIYETRPKEIEGFTTPEQAYLMTDVLKSVVQRGTGTKARVEGLELAGKTGTTNNNIDAWFCGYSPTIETIVWFGRDDNKPIGEKATGGALAAPAFSFYYKKLLEVYPETKRTFDKPEGVYTGIYEGKRELFTRHSPLPNVHNQPREDFDSGMLMEEMEIVENIDPNNAEIELAETINIDDTPTYDDDESTYVEKDSFLHPKKKVPLTPVSNDSGTLF